MASVVHVGFVGSGAVNFGGAEGPWDHSKRLQLLQQHLSLREHGTESQSAHTHPQQCEEVSTSDLVDAVRLQKVTLSEIVDNINDIVEDLQCEHVNLA